MSFQIDRQVQDKIEKKLSEHQIKKTDLRRSILEHFFKNPGIYTQADILGQLQKMKVDVDRVSLYRNLLQLKQLEIIHEVDVNHYTVCQHECDRHRHVLMYCQKCNRHQEVEDHQQLKSLEKALAEMSFFGKNSPLYFKGLCKTCQA